MSKISIILPIYNVEKYIEDCLKSIQEQTFTDFEVIAVDDCGQDNSIAIYESFMKNDSRFKLVKHEKNKGLSAARNTGISNSNSEYIVCIDSDDWVEPILLEAVYNVFEKSEIEAVWFNANMIQDSTGEHYSTIFDPKKFLLNAGWMKITPQNFNKFPDYAWNKAYRKSALEKYSLKFPEGLYFEDADFYLRAYTNIKKVYYIMTPLYNYRMREDSIVTGSSNLEKKFDDIFKLVERAYDYLIETNNFEKYKSILLESFCIKIKMVLIKNRYNFVTKLAKRTLKHIRFPEAYEDLKS